jgi:serine/threonine protein kinase
MTEHRARPVGKRAESDTTRDAVIAAQDNVGPSRTSRVAGQQSSQDSLLPTSAHPTRPHVHEADLNFREDEAVRLTTAALCPFCRAAILTSGDDCYEQCSCCRQTILLLPRAQSGARQEAVPVLYGHYRAICFAGRGGMGVVMRGVDEATGGSVAIKLLIGCDRLREKSIARFHREVAALRSVFHPNIVRLFSHGTIGNQRFLIMDWVDGPDFRVLVDTFRRRRELPCFEVLKKWFLQACSGLAAIHAAGVVHRDIKPSNLMLDPSSNLRIADFGIACTATERAAFPVADEARSVTRVRDPSIGSPFELPLTAAGEFTGTADYMAPECFRSPSAANPQSDMYSLGITFYEISTGERPLISWPAPSALNQSLPEAFDIAIMKLLAKNPADRYSSVYDVASALVFDERGQHRDADQY